MAISRANASHGFGYDVSGFFLRNWLPGGVHFSKIPPQFVRYFQSPPMRDGGGLEGTRRDGATAKSAVTGSQGSWLLFC